MADVQSAWIAFFRFRSSYTHLFVLVVRLRRWYSTVVVVPLLRSSSGVISHPSGRYLRQRVPQWGIVRRKTATLVAVVQPLLPIGSSCVRRKTATLVAVFRALLHR